MFILKIGIIMSLLTVSSPQNFSKYTLAMQPGEALVTNASQASCLKNRDFIFEILRETLKGNELIFEIGTGTADQSIYFSQNFPNVTWQTSDLIGNHQTIIDNVAREKVNNVLKPVKFDLDEDGIHGTYDVVYASNLIHCIPLATTEQLFKKVSLALKVNGLFIVYGPFLLNPEEMPEGYNQTGNINFNVRLQKQDPRIGLKHLSELVMFANKNGLLLERKALHKSANNFVLIFKKA